MHTPEERRGREVRRSRELRRPKRLLALLALKKEREERRTMGDWWAR
jgi:hypothetical protein